MNRVQNTLGETFRQCCFYKKCKYVATDAFKVVFIIIIQCMQPECPQISRHMKFFDNQREERLKVSHHIMSLLISPRILEEREQVVWNGGGLIFPLATSPSHLRSNFLLWLNS